MLDRDQVDVIASIGDGGRPVRDANHADDQKARFVADLSWDLYQARIIPKGLRLREIDPMLILVRLALRMVVFEAHVVFIARKR